MPEVKSGDFVDIGLGEPGAPSLYPTSQWFERHIKANIPALDYEPFYETSEMAGTPARFMGSSIVGPFEGMPGRVASGAVAGAASEAAGRYVASQGYKDYENTARFVGALAGAPFGELTAKGVDNFTQPNTSARQILSNAIAEDFRTGSSPLTPDKLEEAEKNGLTPIFYDYAGVNTKAALQKLGMDNPKAQQWVGTLNDELEKRSANVSQNFTNYLKDIFGQPVDPVNVARAEATIGMQQRDALYDFIKATPEAQAVEKTSALQQLDNSKTMQQVYKQVADNATDPKSGIVVPQVIKGTPGQEETFLHGPQGIVRTPAIASVPDRIIPANLAYYDEAKQVLDGMINRAADATKPDPGEVRRLQSLKATLTGALDEAVPGYDSVRDIASETFNAASAPQAGYNFMKNMDIFKGDKLAEGLNKYTTDLQRQDFAMGSAAYLQEMLDKRGVKAVADYMNQPQAANRMKLALGNEMFDDVYGHVQSQAALANVKALNVAASSGKTPGWVPNVGLPVSGGILGFGSKLIEGANFTPTDTASFYASLGALAGATGAAMINGRQAAIGDKVLKLAASNKAEDWRKIGEMARTDHDVPEFFAKLNQLTQGAGLNMVRSQPAPQYATRPDGYARGGSVIDKAADKLVSESMRNQKLLAHHTEQMLSMPDDAIVQALHVARSVAA